MGSLTLLTKSLLKEKARGVDLPRVSEAKRWLIYQDTVQAMYNLLLDQLRLEMFTRRAVMILEADLRQMLGDISRFDEKRYDGIREVRKHLDEGQIEINVALKLFDTTEEPDAEKRLRGRNRALVNLRNNLSNSTFAP